MKDIGWNVKDGMGWRMDWEMLSDLTPDGYEIGLMKNKEDTINIEKTIGGIGKCEVSKDLVDAWIKMEDLSDLVMNADLLSRRALRNRLVPLTSSVYRSLSAAVRGYSKLDLSHGR
jgi:hypothetical protein